jgi:hypothetical protein
MHQPVPLLAVEWIQIAIFLFIIFSSLAGQLFKTNQERRKQPNRRMPRPPQPDRRPAEPRFGDRVDVDRRPQPERPRSPLQDEIETFLRRAIGQEPEVVAEVVRPNEPESRVPRLVGPPQPEEDELRESVAEHVARRMQQSDIEAREASMGAAIGESDERMESHLGRVFDHSLGQLGTRSESTAVESISQGTDASVWEITRPAEHLVTARQIAEKLRSPNEIASAIVLSEVLRRPTERWS